MKKLETLVSAFGWDKIAQDIANNFNTVYSRINVGRVMQAMKSLNKSYRGPLRALRHNYTGLSLSHEAKQVFNPPARRLKVAGFTNAPDVFN